MKEIKMELDRAQPNCGIDRAIPTNILDDLCSRFIINVPEEERKDLIRLCFQIELAHWFYIDFYCKTAKKTIGLKEFAHNIFEHIPSLQQFSYNVDKIIDEWKEYKYLVPTFGAILLDEDFSNVLLVQSYYSRSSWGFPKGKVNKDEPPWGCAIREVYEETGFNIRELIDPNEYLDARVHEQLVRLYIIPGISRSAKFQPMTRNEIKSVNWFPLTDLPVSKKDAGYKVKGPTGTDSFYMVGPFIRRLRQWIFDHKAKPLRKPRRARHNSCGDLDNLGHKDYPSLKFLKHVKDIKNKTMTELVEDKSKTFKVLTVEETEHGSYSNDDEKRNGSPYRLLDKKQITSNAEIEKFMSQLPNLSKGRNKRKHSETNEKKEDLQISDRRNSSSDNSDKSELHKLKSIELSSLMDAFKNHSRSSSVPTVLKTETKCSCDKSNCIHITKPNRRCKRKLPQSNETYEIQIRKSGSENQLVPIDEIDKLQAKNKNSKLTTINKNGDIYNFPISFNEINLSESIISYGISNWSNFKFDVQSILKCIEEIKI